MQPSLIRTLLIKPFMVTLLVILLLMAYASTAGAVNGTSVLVINEPAVGGHHQP